MSLQSLNARITLTEIRQDLHGTQIDLTVDVPAHNQEVIAKVIDGVEGFITVTIDEGDVNKDRKKIIKEAKRFIKDITDNAVDELELSDRNIRRKILTTEHTTIVDNKEQLVVVVVKGRFSGAVYETGIAKCSPSDVFNKYIGEAIALGRAYGLDVSKFENAPQPNEYANGQIITFPEYDSWYRKLLYRVDGFGRRDDGLVVVKDDVGGDSVGTRAFGVSSGSDLPIISDTNAEY